MAAKVSINSNNMVNMPLVAMRGVVVFPDTINHFDVGRYRSVNAIEYAMRNRVPVFLVAQRDISVETPNKTDLNRYGVVSEVQQVIRISENYIKVLVECKYRARLMDFHDDDTFCTADIMRANVRGARTEDADTVDARVRAIREQLEVYVEHYPNIADDIVLKVFSGVDANRLAEYLAFNLNIDFTDKQSVLDASNTLKRLELIHNILVRENNVLKLEKDINDKVQEAMDQNQREYYLREQIRVISTELGEGGDVTTDAEEYRQKIKALPLEKDYITKLLREVERLVQTPANSQESAVIRSYLDTVVDLPWGIYTEDDFDIAHAAAVLDQDHYGLKKVKDRILEYLAVRKMTAKTDGSIICLVGPPGVGKTSIASSVAKAVGRKFVRMSLGGVKDESEIRGHRRTYVASMPGRIISAIDQAKTSNPLLLMDEIDKLGNDFRGDPASALLEVLDPEQNATFHDHFLDVPYDLSKVMFITTANDASEIPAPLYDRMDVIELSSYTREEKFQIAKQHLIGKQLARHGMTRGQVIISDSAVYDLIDYYTREAGVRSLERNIAAIIRKAAKQIVSSEITSVRVTRLSLESLLGPRLIRGTIASRTPAVGVVNGLAWTAVGGEVMPIETTVIKGTGKLEITGSLGEVMKESAKLAISYVRALPQHYGIPDDLLTNYDIHIHAPEGAVPKDGPSAGVTLTTALVSALCNIPTKTDLAMTGEITLKGRVLAIGGLREKLIAAFKENLTTVLIPKDNLVDLQEIPEEVRHALTIVPVDKVDAVIKAALTNLPFASKRLPRLSEPLRGKPSIPQS